MLENMRNKAGITFLLLFAGVSCCFAGAIDSSKYITVDEIKPGMEAYCLTCYKGSKIEKFEMEVLSVVKGFGPGKDAIMVQGTDERFIHTGPVAGCSGSPVYIEGRLAGALAFGWTFSKDPLYGVTPIEEMLAVGEGDYPDGGNYISFDFSRGIDFEEIDRQIKAQTVGSNVSPVGASVLPCPVITSGLSVGVCQQLDEALRPFGMMAVAGGGGGASNGVDGDVKLEPGSCLAVPLATGDIKMTAMGTVTEVVGDKVYGFGHSFLGYGPVNLPLATGKIHTVVSSVIRSFKFGSAIDIVGALTVDESSAIRGTIGADVSMIPLTINVKRYNDSQERTYNCRIAENQMLTSRLIVSAIAGSALMFGDLPPENTVEYKVSLRGQGCEPIVFENRSSASGINDLMLEITDVVSMLMNNPYKRVKISSINVDLAITNKSSISHIWSVELSDNKVKPGEKVKIDVILESVLAGKKKYSYELKVPKELKQGKYELLVCGDKSYQKFLSKAADYKFRVQNFDTLIKAINNILHIRRDRLYCVFVMGSGGVSVEQTELANLPATKSLVLFDPKRTLKASPYLHWQEKQFETSTLVVDEKKLSIIVEK